MNNVDIKLCAQFPAISDHADCTMAFALAEKYIGYIVFDVHRDFLSAPKGYAVIRINFSLAVLFGSGGQFLTDEHWAHIQNNTFGVFEVMNSTLCEKENESHFVFYSRDIIFECVAENLELIDTVYHQPSSFAALQTILS